MTSITVERTPKKDAMVAIAMLLTIIIPGIFTLGTVQIPTPMMPVTDNPSPYGYTVSLLMFVVPTIVIAWWFIRHPHMSFQRKVWWKALIILVPMGFILDILFGHDFFKFVNTDAVVGIYIPVVGGHVPVEEFIFYFFAFTNTLLIYLWSDEYWFGAYSIPDYKKEIEEKGIKRLFKFNWTSLIVGIVLFAAAWVFKKYFSEVPDGIPAYFLYMLVISVIPSMLFFPTVVDFINWRAFSLTFFLLLLVPMFWEATLAGPYQWWGYHSEPMMGIFVKGWANLPLEAVLVWFASAFTTVIMYEMVKILYYVKKI